jgi:hypothetical protein
VAEFCIVVLWFITYVLEENIGLHIQGRSDGGLLGYDSLVVGTSILSNLLCPSQDRSDFYPEGGSDCFV